jgi:Spy/CpxP family protein refolding chaperone
MNENTAKRNAALWVAAVFVLGTALGGVFGYFYASHVNAASRGPALSEPERRARRLDQLTHDLSLTDAQRQQMDGLFLQIHGEFEAVRKKNAAQLETDLDAERQKSRDQIRAILTPDQKPKFEEFLKKLDEDRKRNAAQGPPGTPSGRPSR